MRLLLRLGVLVTYELQEGLVEAEIVGELRVECRRHRASLPDGYRIGAFGRENFNAAAYV